MKKSILVILCIIYCFIAISQEEKEVSKHEHFVSTTIMGVRNHLAFGYEYKYVPNDWMKIGAGMSLGGEFSQGVSFSAFSRLTLMPKVFLNFGKDWGWAEIGFTQNTSLNFQSSAWPVEYIYGVHIGPTFTFGNKWKHDLGVYYYYNFTWLDLSPTFSEKVFDDQHWFGFTYRFKFK